MPSSQRKLAGELTPGDYVWHAGQYWLVDKTTPIATTAAADDGSDDNADHDRPDYGSDLLIHLCHPTHTGTMTIWPYRANFDVAVHPTTPPSQYT